MTTIESNRLIAEFMTGHYRDKRKKSYPFPFPVIEVVPAEKIMGYGSVPEGKIKHYEGTPDMMKYHSSWDWLMPVVEKIESVYTKEYESGFIVRIEYKDIFVMTLDTSEELIICDQSESKLEGVYWTCVKFIKWYNSNKDNNG